MVVTSGGLRSRTGSAREAHRSGRRSAPAFVTDQTILVSVRGRGLFRSVDGGASFREGRRAAVRRRARPRQLLPGHLGAHHLLAGLRARPHHLRHGRDDVAQVRRRRRYLDAPRPAAHDPLPRSVTAGALPALAQPSVHGAPTSAHVRSIVRHPDRWPDAGPGLLALACAALVRGCVSELRPQPRFGGPRARPRRGHPG